MIISKLEEFVRDLAEKHDIDYTFKFDLENNISDFHFYDTKEKKDIVGYTIDHGKVKNLYIACVKIAENLEEKVKDYNFMKITDISAMYPKTMFTYNKYCKSDFEFTKLIDKRMDEIKYKSRFEIKDVIFNDPATIVFWSDGTKTVVKAQDIDDFDPEKGLAMAISKKALGNKREYYHTFLKYLKKYEKKIESESSAQKAFEHFLERVHNSIDK